MQNNSDRYVSVFPGEIQQYVDNALRFGVEEIAKDIKDSIWELLIYAVPDSSLSPTEQVIVESEIKLQQDRFQKAAFLQHGPTRVEKLLE